MKLVVADTGPLNYLSQIESLWLLPELVERVIVPKAVLTELRHAKAPPTIQQWVRQLPVWIEVREPSSPLPRQPQLSEADLASVALAKEFNCLLLMDDRRARRAASEAGVPTIGTLGLLEAAAAKDLIELPTMLIRLQQTNVFLEKELVSQAVSRDAKRREKGG